MFHSSHNVGKSVESAERICFRLSAIMSICVLLISGSILLSEYSPQFQHFESVGKREARTRRFINYADAHSATP